MLRYICHFVDVDKLNKDSVVVDAGACKGMFVEFLKQHTAIRDENICAIEPCRGNHESFKNTLYTLFDGSLVGADYVGPTISFQELVGLNGWGNSFEFYKNVKSSKFKGFREYEVPVLRVTDLFSHFGIDRIDYLKMDIVGMEKQVLETMPIEMAEKIGQISMETYLQVWSLRDAVSRLKTMGFDDIIVDKKKNEIYGSRS